MKPLSPPRPDVRQYATIARAFGRWALLGALAGAAAGPASAAFLEALRWASRANHDNPWMLALLPLSGALIHALYTAFGGIAGQGNNLLIEEIHRNEKPVPLRMAPLSFIAPIATLLTGGSVASVGTSIQLGGTLADAVARVLRLTREERRVLLMAGLSAGFGSVLGAPAAGAIFGMEVQSVGRIRYQGLVPCVFAAITSTLTVALLGVKPTAYPQVAPAALAAVDALKVGVAAIAFGWCGLAYIELTRFVGNALARIAGPRRWLRPALGGAAMAILIAATGTAAYSGLSETALATALAGMAVPATAFAFKLVYTAVTAGSGYRAGDVTPLFVMGATLGGALAPALGVSGPLLAAVGFVSVFAGASNTPIASAVLAAELFGPAMLPWALLGCVIAYVFSGHRSIYATQRVDTPKHVFTVTRRRAVRDVMTRPAAVVSPEASPTEARETMRARGVGSVIVVEDSQPIGIVTSGDLSRGGPRSRARDIMTPGPISISEGAPLAEAARLMLKHGLKRLVVVGGDGALTGVIGRSSILLALVEGAHLQIDPSRLAAHEPGAPQTVAAWARPDLPADANDPRIAAGATPLEAARQMLARRINRLTVVDAEGNPLGSIDRESVLRGLVADDV